MLEIATVLHRDSAELEPPSLRRTTDFIFGNTPTKRNPGCRPEPCVSDGLSPSPFKKARGNGPRVAEGSLGTDFNSRLAAASEGVQEEGDGCVQGGLGRRRRQDGEEGDEQHGSMSDDLMSQGDLCGGNGDEEEVDEGWGEEVESDGEYSGRNARPPVSDELPAPEHGHFFGSGRGAGGGSAPRAYLPRPSNASTLTALGTSGIAGGAGNFLSPPRVQQLMAVPRWPQSPTGKASGDEGKDNSPYGSPPRGQPLQGKPGMDEIQPQQPKNLSLNFGDDTSWCRFCCNG